jgi:hypothetical protein
MNPNEPDYPRKAEAGYLHRRNRPRKPDALNPVSRFRNVVFSQALHGSHDLSGAVWDSRQGRWRSDALENLF